MVIHDPTMPSFKLLTDSDEERSSPLPVPSIVKPSIPKYDSVESGFGTSDTDPTWWYQKKYLGGDHFPSDEEGGCVDDGGEDDDEESITSEQILEMFDIEIVFSEPCGDEAKELWFRKRVKRLEKGTLITLGRWSKEDDSSSEKENEELECKGDSRGEGIEEEREVKKMKLHSMKK